ncbi:hypothetical protein BU14_0058s0081 [Porphyra umbilicalis]|uniref:Chitin-binding type-4 domain-containing protein n=1 Tax=Porphyra umbilicalis TaxID=2786 RepID=A0A1X6PH77_PORUM|nr:hypothetical protein BU14_0058s0081 [Porphyra umbilicalis]|eukprot:OSX80170.1 hypothetical protein BU14_0058s0081 [Porphyra umbilicalis]
MGGSTPVVALATAVAAVGFATSAAGHALMTTPRQRGGLKLSSEFNFPVIDPTAPTDFCPHCLNAGGTGTVKAANGGDWSPYDPLDAGARAARAADHGVCGDPATQSPGAHTVGGTFYHGGKTVAAYTPGGVVDFEVGVTTSHNGFFEWWVCDLDACGAMDLTNGCFGVPGACTRLDRVAHPSCEAGTDVACGPIQAAYPSRWYMPCRGNPPPTVGNTQVLGGPDGKMRYRLPAALTCTRCVIQWYWVTANSCNPPGMAEYNFPAAWAGCPGDGGSVGGIARGAAPCGPGGKWPEEFWTCADVVIGAGGGPTPTATPTATAAPTATSSGATPTPLPTCSMPPAPACSTATPTPPPSPTPTAVPTPTPTAVVTSSPAPTPSPTSGGTCAASHLICASPARGMAQVPCCDPRFFCKEVNEWHWYCADRVYDP